ncbi:hypothetical protein KUTeg_022533 [Tegillarca granosa]|uniref:Uncharacterized protein n=1 Tax=Tegillarca granosa TaxID=220873 RepID=A0ABQ9E6P1_TEGGR|nr:hypothetical protein KUTeg_022533 [Tegillarca granosa]
MNLDENDDFQYTNHTSTGSKTSDPRIYSLKDVYYFENEADGLTDVKTFDITEFDSICFDASQEKPKTVSISEMLSHGHHNSNSVFRIITRTPFKQVIDSKWLVYRPAFLLVMILHFIGIGICTLFAVLRREQSDEHSAVSIAASIQIGMLGITYIIIAFFVIRRKKQRYDLMKSRKVILHHSGYICLLVTCSVSLSIDVVLNNIPGIKTDVPIIIALVLGWWFSVFFLSPFRRFSFFTVMMRRVFFGDFLRFFVIMAFELVSFTAAMYLLFLPPDYTTSNVPVEDFGGYFQTMLTMFKLMIGLGDIEILYESKIPSLAIVIFVIFVITTYILMVNALIAMMSNTCTQVFQEKFHEWRIQQLSAILAIEDITRYLGEKNIKINLVERQMEYFNFNNKKQNIEKHKRFFMRITSSELDEATDESRYIMEREKKMILEDLLLSWFSSQQISVESQNMLRNNTRNDNSSSFRRRKESRVIYVRAASSQQNNRNRRNAVYGPPTVEI